ncbi:MAG TPA: LON peptidase substrate-binding domain-containing protein, partial [Stellaceae bacterium]|nr:LON peptidase substrate-binding domain-containing protein [Stellaceae bacterium]
GMIQPLDGQGDMGEPPLYRVGCLGRITEFRETEDGRYLISLKGIARFDVSAEPPRDTPFRIVVPNWSHYEGDLTEADPEFDRERLNAALKPFFHRHGIEADFEAIAKAPAERLITSLSMLCPFAPREKQALLEAENWETRGKLLTALIEMGAVAGSGDAGPARH